MFSRHVPRTALTSLSLTPLIDVVFLLLIFFLVATRFEEEERAMDVNLPKASEAKPMIATPDEMFIDLTAEGRFFVDGQELDLQRLQAVLQDANQVQPGRQRVVIRADREARTAHLVAVMNACNQASIRQYSVATE